MEQSEIYPIGTYVPAPYTDEERVRRINHIRDLPKMLEAAIHDLSADELQQSYRSGSWSIHELVHHVSDSHAVAFLRTKLTLTVNEPVLPVYPQERFVETADVVHLPCNLSLTQLHVIHTKWYEILSRVEGPDWDRTGYHPEQETTMTLWHLLGLYAWHGHHHAMQIMRWRERNGR